MAGLFAKRMRSRARERMEVLQAESSGMDATNSWADVQFLENSTEVLLDVRELLNEETFVGWLLCSRHWTRLL